MTQHHRTNLPAAITLWTGQALEMEKARQFSWIVAGMLLSALLVLCAVIPPFQSPDEIDHFKRGYMLSRGQFTLHTLGKHDSGGMLDGAVESLNALYGQLPGNREGRLRAPEDKQAQILEWTGKEQFAIAPGTAYYLPLIYTPSAIGILVGKAAGSGVQTSYYLARICTALAVVGLVWLAFRLYPPPPLAVAMLALPITLFQASSTGIDSVALALTILVCSLYARACAQGFMRKWEAAVFLAGIFLVATSRAHMLLMILLPFFGMPRTRMLTIGRILVVLTALAWMAFALKTTVDTRVPRAHSTGEAIQYYVVHAFDFIRLIDKTELVNRENFWTGFVGYLGWLDTPLRQDLYDLWKWVFGGLAAISLAIFLRFATTRQSNAAALQSAALVAVSICATFLVFFLMLCTWTAEYPATLIQGIQGRYFALPAAALIYGLSLPLQAMPSHMRTLVLVLLAGTAGLTLVSMTHTLIARYYL